MRKRLIAVTVIITIILSMFSVSAFGIENSGFLDVPPEHDAYIAVTYLVEQGIINGKSETEFAPADTLKREEFAKILVNLASLEKVDNPPIYMDVPAGTWYAPFVGSVTFSGYMEGISDSAFGTGLELSRQDLAVILFRHAQKIGLPIDGDVKVLYADDNQISDYAKEAVVKLSSVGVIKPDSNNCINPKTAVSRSDTAVAVYELLMLEKKYDEKMGRYSSSPTRWDGPFDTPLDDKLAENMPVIFDPTAMPTTELLFEDFNDQDYGKIKKGFSTNTASLSADEGYNGSGCAKITDSGSLELHYTDEVFEQSMYLLLECKLKAEDIAVTGSPANYRTIIQIYDGTKWLAESAYDHRGALNVSTKEYSDADENGWVTVRFIVQIPEVVNALSKTLYTVRLNCYMNGLSGTVYYDDFKLSTLLFEPMDTVLMTPNYKGLIYGEGGIGDIALRAHVNDYNGGYDLSKFRFLSKIVDAEDNIYAETSTDNITTDMDVYFSSSDLKMDGEYYLETYILDKETEEVVQKQSWTLRKREEDYRPKYYIDEDIRLIKEGEPTFSTSIYHIGYADQTNGGFDMSQLLGTDVDTYLNIGMRPWYDYGVSPDFQRDLQILADNGKNICLYTGPFYYSQMIYNNISDHVEKQTDIRGYLTRMINRFKDLPGLESYYTQDERSANTVGEELRWQNEIIAANDLDHYTWGAICGLIETRPGIWAKTTDVIVSDPYPVTGLADQDLYEVTKFVRYLRESNPNRPVGLILQNFWFHNRSNKLGYDLRGPSLEEARNMAFQAICEGACMINCYAYGPTANPPSPGRTYEEEWADYQTVLSEVERFEPIIVSNLPAPYYRVKGNGQWLNHMSKRHDGKSYLFTVNNQNTTKVAYFHLDGVKEITAMYTGKTYTADENGWFEIEFEPIQVEVFCYDQKDYKSSHCELERFGLISEGDGIIMMNSEDETPTFVIPSGVTEVDFSFTVSAYAQVYINGEKVDTKGTLNIDALSELKVKVVSEDERFNTEKTFLLKRK